MIYTSIRHYKIINHETKRRSESSKILDRYPDRIPVIIIKGSKETPDIDRSKYLVQYDMTISEFMTIIRKHINIKKDQALFLMINDTIPKQSDILSSIYKENKDPDGLLYITYIVESTFG